MKRIIEQGLPILLLLGSGCAYAWPAGSFDPFLWSKPYLPTMFAVAMFAIGAVLPLDEVAETFRHWRSVIFGTGVQYLTMPALAFVMAKSFGLSEDFQIGIILAGCVPDAMASGVVTLMAKGNASYSVGLTTATTIVSPIMVTLTMWILLGASVPYDYGHAASMLFWQVVFPVTMGQVLARVSTWFAFVADRVGSTVGNLAILWIVAFVVAENRDRLAHTPSKLLVALVTLNLLGYLIGYAAGWAGRLSPRSARALSITVGMQNAGLGTVLALQLFPDRPAIQVPTALYTFGCMLTGTLYAWLLSRQPIPEQASSGAED